MTEYTYSSMEDINSMVIELWNKIRKKCFERDVVYSLYLIEIILAVIVLFI